MAFIDILPLSQAITGVSILFLLAYLITPLLSWSREIPGPLLAKYTRLWYMWQKYRNDFHWTNIKLHREKGAVVQIMPGYFTIDDPKAHKIIYGHGNAWKKGEFYVAWNVSSDPHATNLFAARDQGLHASMRRKVASMYSMTSLVSYEPYVDHCIDLLHSQLDRAASAGSAINLGRWLQFFAFDAVSIITFGERLGFLDEGKDVHEMIQSLDYTHIILTFAGVYPWLTPLFKAVAGVFTGDKLLYFQKFASEKITMARQEHGDLAEDGPATTMVRKFLDAQRREPKKGLTDWDVAANAGSNIGAGSDTTAIGLIATVYYLFRDPAILERARQEMDSEGLPDRPSFQEAQKLPFLQAVIKESMRLLPGVGLPLWREVPKGGAVVCGRFFPEGTNLGVNAWVSHHNQQVYGEDADLFRPERWQEASGETAVAMEQSWIPFGLGSRTCIGKNVSLLEINKIIPVLVRDFDFYFQDQHGNPETRDYITLKNKWFLKAPHLYARVVRRNLKAG
ncbi:cytochrome P450 [Rhypophila decipiens]|uniref:Cytochrome P450 n=1 Tax=Rhypophila decipiens TaxID=261697 RepID=A0AAN7B0R2_9PEZI|nr:cytochrome P450 [Rhypophila decipiens]